MDIDKPGVTPLMEIGKRTLRFRSSYVREAIGEFFGTLIVGFMCVGAGGQFLIRTKINESGFESQVVPVLGIILGIMTAIMITGGVSGGHVNPAVSISLAVAGELSWYSVPGYVISQFLGATVGALLGWSLIYPSLRQILKVPNEISLPEYDMHPNNSLAIASIFSPIKPDTTLLHGFSTEVVLTSLLIMALCGAIDKHSPIKPPGYLIPIMIPLVIASLAFTHEVPSGALLNPARDIGPRLAAWMLGWKPEKIFMTLDSTGSEQHWWVVGLFGPILGGIIGAIIYSCVIGPQVNLDHLDESEEEFPDRETALRILAAKQRDWRETVFVPRGNNPVVNVSPYSSYSFASNNNQKQTSNGNTNSIPEGYQLQRTPYNPKQQQYPNLNRGGQSSH